MFGIGIFCNDTEVFLKLVEPGNPTVVPVNSFVQSIIMRGAHFFYLHDTLVKRLISRVEKYLGLSINK